MFHGARCQALGQTLAIEHINTFLSGSTGSRGALFWKCKKFLGFVVLVIFYFYHGKSPLNLLNHLLGEYFFICFFHFFPSTLSKSKGPEEM